MCYLSTDKIVHNVSVDKSKWHVTVDGNIHQNGYILFYVQTNQKPFSMARAVNFLWPSQDFQNL